VGSRRPGVSPCSMPTSLMSFLCHLWPSFTFSLCQIIPSTSGDHHEGLNESIPKKQLGTVRGT
jgi:hypothetical protein